MNKLILFILSSCLASAQTYTEYYVQGAGSNLNAGTSISNTSENTYAGGTWVASTGVFTVASGDPAAQGVAADQFASVYTAGDTTTGFVGRVLSANSTTITVSLVAVSGTPPADGTRTLKIGGAWAGPSGTSLFPWGFIKPAATKVSGDFVRVNWKAQTYSVTAGGSIGYDGPIFYEAYAATPGDDAGMATIDGGATGTAYTVLDLADTTADAHSFENFIFQNNGNAGTTTQPLIEAGQATFFRNCTFQNSYGKGIINFREFIIYECEGTNNFLSNTGTQTVGGLQFNITGTLATRCYSHDNLKDGYSTDGGVLLNRCISDSNPGDGAGSSGDENLFVFHCEFYNNGTDGYSLGEGSADPMNCFILNSNFIDNGGYGWKTVGQETPGLFIGNGFGAGTAANVSGNIQYDRWWLNIESISYSNDVTPYTDPANGDFSVSHAEAVGTGFGSFLQTASGYTGTVGYPDRGAQQQ